MPFMLRFGPLHRARSIIKRYDLRAQGEKQERRLEPEREPLKRSEAGAGAGGAGRRSCGVAMAAAPVVRTPDVTADPATSDSGQLRELSDVPRTRRRSTFRALSALGAARSIGS